MRAPSLRRRLLMGILLPVVAFIAFNTFSLYRQALASLNTAYDRTLLASAKTISEQLDVSGYDDDAQLRAIVPYAALEAFEARQAEGGGRGMAGSSERSGKHSARRSAPETLDSYKKLRRNPRP